jgi:hypothetical protein
VKIEVIKALPEGLGRRYKGLEPEFKEAIAQAASGKFIRVSGLGNKTAQIYQKLRNYCRKNMINASATMHYTEIFLFSKTPVKEEGVKTPSNTVKEGDVNGK